MGVDFNFLLCTERSGSNFITKLLNAHPNICGPSPNHLIRPFTQNRLNYGDLNDNNNWNTLLQDVDSYLQAQMAEWNSKVDLEELRRNCNQGSIKSIFEYVFTKEAKALGKKALFIKENRVFNFSPYLLAAFPNCKFVYMVRDIRDFALSWKKSPNHPGAMKKAVTVWKEDQIEFKKLYSYLLDLNKIVLVKYEDLISNPEVKLNRICSLLNVEYSPTMLYFHKDDLTRKNAGKIKDWGNLAKPVMSSNFKKYLKELTPTEIKFLEIECSELMDFYGYEKEFKEGVLSDFEINEIDKIEESYLNQPTKELSSEEKDVRTRRMAAINTILSRKL